jgi:hypothetical protein
MVEIKQKNSSEWTPCNNFPTKTTEYTASNLSDGQVYELRVRAVNEAGPGAPSKPTQPQKAEPPVCKLSRKEINKYSFFFCLNKIVSIFKTWHLLLTNQKLKQLQKIL